MHKEQISIRIANPSDAQKLLELYAPYVENTAITFEHIVPTVEEFANKINHILTKYPYLVATENEQIVGYAYAGIFRKQAAYNWAVEVTIYVRQDKKQLGIGKNLYKTLETILAAQNVLNLNACIAYLDNDDEYLTKDSVHFHEHVGYKLAGRFRQCGYKFERWYDIIWMEKHIGEHICAPCTVIAFPQIRTQFPSLL